MIFGLLARAVGGSFLCLFRSGWKQGEDLPDNDLQSFNFNLAVTFPFGPADPGQFFRMIVEDFNDKSSLFVGTDLPFAGVDRNRAQTVRPGGVSPILDLNSGQRASAQIDCAIGLGAIDFPQAFGGEAFNDCVAGRLGHTHEQSRIRSRGLRGKRQECETFQARKIRAGLKVGVDFGRGCAPCKTQAENQCERSE